LGFSPSGVCPNRARTKGKDEPGVGYVKNAIAGRRFAFRTLTYAALTESESAR
jgi:transposase